MPAILDPDAIDAVFQSLRDPDPEPDPAAKVFFQCLNSGSEHLAVSDRLMKAYACNSNFGSWALQAKRAGILFRENEDVLNASMEKLRAANKSFSRYWKDDRDASGPYAVPFLDEPYPFPPAVAVEARPDYRLWMRFANGVEGEQDLTEYVLDPEDDTFHSLANERMWFTATLDRTNDTVVWDDGTKEAAELLYPGVRWPHIDTPWEPEEGNLLDEMVSYPALVSVETLPDYRLRLRYADGQEGEFDLSHAVRRGAWPPLRNPAFFRQVRLHETGDIVWPDDFGYCADIMYYRLQTDRTRM